MNRLNGLKYNNKLWEVKRNNQKECNILDKKIMFPIFLKEISLLLNKFLIMIF